MAIAREDDPKFDLEQIIKIGTANVSSDGSTVNWTTVPHNLGFRPQVDAFLNNVGLSTVFTDGDIPLPTYTSVGISGGSLTFQSWLHAGVDATNLYLVLLNASGAPISALTVKYKLKRQRAA